MLFRIDPLGVFNFYLTLLDSSSVVKTLITAALSYKVAGFSECSGLEATLEVFDYKEGGLNDHVHKFPTRASFSNTSLVELVSWKTWISLPTPVLAASSESKSSA